jgi:hypothetical protein
VQGRLGDSWQVGLRGNMQRFEDPTDKVRFGDAVAQSSVMSMEVHGAGNQSYRIASTKSSWAYADPESEGDADVRAHNFEWRNGPARVQVRYFKQENLFRDVPLQSNSSNLVEVGGAVSVLQTRRNDLGVALRVKQESFVGQADFFRTVDLSANGMVSLVPSLILHYGVDSRFRMDGQEWAPRTGAEWKLTENTSLVGSAMVKVLDRDTNTSLVAAQHRVFLRERTRCRGTRTFGIVTGKDEENRFSAIATITEVDEALRMIFADEQNPFWDAVEVAAGDVRRDLRVAYRKQFGNVLAVDVATTAGTASQRDPAQPREKVYIAGDLQSTFNPTRTTLAVSYRDIQQPLENGEEEYHSERIHLRMAQSLYLPIDIKLLFGLELARANSPYLVDTLTSGGRRRSTSAGWAF